MMKTSIGLQAARIRQADGVTPADRKREHIIAFAVPIRPGANPSLIRFLNPAPYGFP
jgi:hypothetical protein